MKSLKRTRIGKYKIEDKDKFIDLENILEKSISIETKDIKNLLDLDN